MSFIKTTALAVAVIAGSALAAQAQTPAPSQPGVSPSQATGPNTNRGGVVGGTASGPSAGPAAPNPTGNPTGAGVAVPGPGTPGAPAGSATGSGPQR